MEDFRVFSSQQHAQRGGMELDAINKFKCYFEKEMHFAVLMGM